LIFTWDALHGEIEGFSVRGEHRGAFDPVSGQRIKPPVKGRRIRV
jgi:Cytotoxic